MLGGQYCLPVTKVTAVSRVDSEGLVATRRACSHALPQCLAHRRGLESLPVPSGGLHYLRIVHNGVGTSALLLCGRTPFRLSQKGRREERISLLSPGSKTAWHSETLSSCVSMEKCPSGGDFSLRKKAGVDSDGGNAGVNG